MPKRRRTRLGATHDRLRSVGRQCVAVACRLRQAFCRRDVPVEALLADRATRRALEREIRAGLRRLVRVLGPSFAPGLAIAVQQSVGADRPLAGCSAVGHRADGAPFALVRLALSVDGRRLGIDEVLAVLADQCCALAADQCGGDCVVVPFELTPTAPAEPVRPAALRADPLVAHLNGHEPSRRAA